MKPTNRDPEAVTARLCALPDKDDRVRVSLRLLPSVDKQLDELARLRRLDRNTAISVAIAQRLDRLLRPSCSSQEGGEHRETCRKCGELIQPTDRAPGLRTSEVQVEGVPTSEKEEGQRDLSEKIERTEQALLELAQAHMNKVRLLGALSEAVADVAALQGKLAEVQAAAEQGSDANDSGANRLVGNRQAACRGVSGKGTIARCLATTRTTRLSRNFGRKRSGAGKQGSFETVGAGGKRQQSCVVNAVSDQNPRSDLERVGIPGQERVRRWPRSARGGSTGATSPASAGIRYRGRSMLSNWGLYCDLEIVTDELREQQDDQWRVSVLLRRIGRKRVRAADFRWAAAEIRAWAKSTA